MIDDIRNDTLETSGGSLKRLLSLVGDQQLYAQRWRIQLPDQDVDLMVTAEDDQIVIERDSE